jgi:hypothetical protein
MREVVLFGMLVLVSGVFFGRYVYPGLFSRLRDADADDEFGRDPNYYYLQPRIYEYRLEISRHLLRDVSDSPADYQLQAVEKLLHAIQKAMQAQPLFIPVHASMRTVDDPRTNDMVVAIKCWGYPTPNWDVHRVMRERIRWQPPESPIMLNAPRDPEELRHVMLLYNPQAS